MGTLSTTMTLQIKFSLYYGSKQEKFVEISHELTNDEIKTLTELARQNTTTTGNCMNTKGSIISIYINDVLVSNDVLTDLNYCPISNMLPKALPVETQKGGEDTSVTLQTQQVTTEPITEQKQVTTEPITEQKQVTTEPITEQKQVTTEPITEQKQVTTEPITEQKQVTTNTESGEELSIKPQTLQNSNKLKLKIINQQTVKFELEFGISKEVIEKFNIIKNSWSFSYLLNKYIQVFINSTEIYKCYINKNQKDISSLSGGRKTRDKYNHKKQTKRNKKRSQKKKHNKRRNKKTQR
jgi:hypothetical protein